MAVKQRKIMKNPKQGEGMRTWNSKKNKGREQRQGVKKGKAGGETNGGGGLMGR